MDQLNVLISKAATIAGSEYKLAQQLEMQQPTISAWKKHKRPCTAGDRAALAYVAGEDAALAAIEGVVETLDLETEKGRLAKVALERALAKWRKR